MRSANCCMMAAQSLALLTPSEPVQRQRPLLLLGTGVNQCLEIGSTAHDAWQAEDGARWVVWMDNEHDTCFVGYRSDFLQEIDQVGTQAFRSDAFVAVQFLLELFQGEAFF